MPCLIRNTKDRLIEPLVWTVGWAKVRALTRSCGNSDALYTVCGKMAPFLVASVEADERPAKLVNFRVLVWLVVYVKRPVECGTFLLHDRGLNALHDTPPEYANLDGSRRAPSLP